MTSSETSNLTLETKLKVYISRRATLYQRAQQAHDLIKGIKDPKILKSFQVRCRDLDETRNEMAMLEDSINEIQVTLEPDKQITHQTLNSFDDLYYNCISILESLKSETPQALPMTSKSETTISDTVKLPRIPLKIFSGNLTEFIPWYNLFCSLVNNSSIPPVQKFLYLQSSLDGEPLNLIKHLPATDDNYTVAINILLERYHSRRRLATSYVEKLLSMEPLKTESYSKLRAYYENLSQQYFALEALKLPNLSDFILFYITFRNLDPHTRKVFEAHFNKDVSSSSTSSVVDPLPTFKQILDFLSNQCKILETSNLTSTQVTCQRPFNAPQPRNTNEFRSASDKGTAIYRKANKYPVTKGSFVATTNSKHSKYSSANCPLCQAAHSLYTCQQFRTLSVSQRRNNVISLGRCTNCLGNHDSSKCGSNAKCLRCNSRSHHTLLHPEDSAQPQSNSSSGSTPKPNVFSSVAQSLEPPTVLLGTAMIHVFDVTGGIVVARVLIDSGSQCSFISKSFFSKLGLPCKRTDVTVTGLGQTSVSQQKAIGSINLKSRLTPSPILSTQVVILDKLASCLPSTYIHDQVKENFSHLPLADPNFYIPAPIDGIIGAELFPLICKGDPQLGGPGLPSALPSLFGWIIMGPVNPMLRLSAFFAEVNLDDALKRFWEIEQPPSSDITDPEDLTCEEIFTSTHTRDTDGRYMVPLLLKNNHNELGGSFGYAMRCLLSTERKLTKNPILRDAYHSFMRDYEESGHMRKVEVDSFTSSYFIPHHAIFNPSSPTTKIRIVFNGSAPSTSGLSLNDVLYIGPKLQKDITSIISMFRFHFIVLIADICKMYRQIKVLENQTHFQQILWRYSPEDPVSVYELLVVTWGLRSSSYLACRSLKQLANDEAQVLPRVSEVIKEETYIDDVISGSSSVDDALKLQADLIDVFSKAGFELRKWSSNNPALLASFPSDHVQSPLIFNTLDDDNRVKVLGLQWDPTSDDFSYHISDIEPRTTKREILSDISKLYDPMGWLSPVVLIAKSLIQQLWVLGIGWDDKIPPDLQDLWNSYVLQFSSLSEVRIPRLFLSHLDTQYNLIGFSDASERGYGAVLYLHVTHSQGSPSIYIVMAKSRVAPLKPLSIPRLELCGALLLSKVFKVCLPLFTSRISLASSIAFTDSSVVLAWLKTSPHRLKQFVANRVVEITSVINPGNWYHVVSEDNPADCASRGLMPQTIASHPLWFTGPPWFQLPKSEWPIFANLPLLPDIPEMKSLSTFVAVKENKPENFMILRYSSFQRMLRITAWILRVPINFKNSSQKLVGPLASCELKASLHRLVKLVQNEHFSIDISNIKKNKDCSPRLRSLTPFVDPSGLLRVGGRLRLSNLPHETKHPLLLPKSSNFTLLLIDYYHLINLHVGPRALQSILQRQFWILSARQVIRSRLSKCLPCLKMRTQFIQPQMGDLPLSRIQQSRPFQVVGTDFGGPFTIRESTRRNARTSKAYLCLFVCFSTKAVHLEVVSDLSSDAFLAAFDRFISRRGKCSTVYSDCGTNYIGAQRYLSDLHHFFQNPHNNDKVQTNLANKSIKWCLNPPSAPHFGGIWEAGIKSAKHLLRRVIGDRSLTFEQLSTVFTRAEAVLNSRPLCPLSTDPSELEPLTPGHFLIGCPLTALPELDLTEVPQNRLSQWQLLRQLSQSFWKRWRNEYLSSLTQRQKWTSSTSNIKVDDLVLLKDNKTPPLCWRLGRVEAVHPGQDGIVRVVTLRTAQGHFRRPVVKLVPLPCP